jgi:hypothetical protein
MEEHQLENFYSGRDAWQGLVRAHAENWPSCDFQDALLKHLHGNIEIAKVIYSHVGDDALNWIDRPIPALDGLTPIQCLIEGKKKRLQEMLMRMPC